MASPLPISKRLFRAKLTFALATIFTSTIIIGVHYTKEQDRHNRMAGVYRDDERRKQRLENIADLERQNRLRAELEKEQTVSSTTE